MKNHYDIIIVGSGMAGLSLAAKCQENNRDYLLIEKTDRVGGRVGSISKDGYIFDIGFQVYNTAYTQTTQTTRIPTETLHPFKPGAAIVTDNGISIFSDPFRDPGSILDTLFSPHATISDKWKIISLKNELKDYNFFEESSQEISTFKFLHQYGFSDKIIHNFFKPFFAGVFLEEELNTSARFFKFVFSTLNKGFATLPEGGMQAIPNRLFEQLSSARVHCNTAIERIDSSHLLTLVNGHQVSFRKLILTGESIRFASDQPVHFNPVYTLYLTTSVSIPKPKYIHLYPDDDLMNNMAVVSKVSPSYTSHNDQLLSVTLLGNRGKQSGIDSEVMNRLSNYYGGSITDYEVKQSMFIEKATLLQKPGSFAPKRSKLSNIHFAGDSQTHGSIEGAVLSGESAYLKVAS